MINKYPIEFEEIYQKILVERKEEFLEIMKSYSEMLERENWSIPRAVHYLGEYVKERNGLVKEIEKKYIK